MVTIETPLVGKFEAIAARLQGMVLKLVRPQQTIVFDLDEHDHGVASIVPEIKREPLNPPSGMPVEGEEYLQGLAVPDHIKNT